MPMNELPPLSDALANMIAMDRDEQALPDGARERVAARLATTIGLGVAAALTTKTAAASTLTKTAAVTAATTTSAKVAVGIAVVAFAAGTGTGAAIHAEVTRAAPITGAATTPTAILVPKASVAPVASAAQVIEIEPSASARVVVAPPASITSAPSRDSELAEERAMIDRARRDISKGNSSSALSTLSEHARTFPRGRMGEEREALTVIALAKGGQLDAARTKARRFKATFPKSVLLPAVMGATGLEEK